MMCRFLIETGASVAAAVLCLTTLLWRNWIELAFGVDPDRGSGALEWTIVFGALAIAVGASLAARAQWRRISEVQV